MWSARERMASRMDITASCGLRSVNHNPKGDRRGNPGRNIVALTLGALLGATFSHERHRTALARVLSHMWRWLTTPWRSTNMSASTEVSSRKCRSRGRICVGAVSGLSRERAVDRERLLLNIQQLFRRRRLYRMTPGWWCR